MTCHYLDLGCTSDRSFSHTSRRPYSCIGELKQRRRNENGRKAIGLDLQNNNFARASRFLVHFFAVTSRLRRETS